MCNNLNTSFYYKKWQKTLLKQFIPESVSEARKIMHKRSNNWDYKIVKRNRRRYSVKMVFFQISQNSRENICARDSFFNEVEVLGQMFYMDNLQFSIPSIYF